MKQLMLNIAGLEQLFQSPEDMTQNPQNIPFLIPGVHSLDQTETYLSRIEKFLSSLNLGINTIQDYYNDSVAIALHYVRNMRTGDFKTHHIQNYLIARTGSKPAPDSRILLPAR